jgi:hypothetical protein
MDRRRARRAPWPGRALTVQLGDLSDPDSRFRRTLKLARPIDTGRGVTIVEVEPGNSGDASGQVELAGDDYAVAARRPHAAAADRRPERPRVLGAAGPRHLHADRRQAARDEATIKLIALDLSYRGGLKSERAGDYQFTLSGDPVADREAIIAGLAKSPAIGGGMVMA